MSQIVQMAVLVPVLLLFAAFLIPVLDQKKARLVPGLVMAIAVYNFLVSLVVCYWVLFIGDIVYHFGEWSPPWGIEFVISYLEAFMMFLICGVYLLIIIFSNPSLGKELKPKVFNWYYTLLFLLKASLLGMIFTNDLFNFFVFVEISAITSVAIISVKDSRDSIDASVKYLFLSVIGSAFLLFAIGLLFMVTGHLNMTYVHQVLSESGGHLGQSVKLSLIFVFIALALKAALFPFHIWLPDAHSSAAVPSSALLSGVVVEVYVVGLIKILFQVYGLDYLMETGLLVVILLLSVMGIILGSIFAIGQSYIKRMLAYSTVAQMGYISLGMAMVTERGMTGGLLHVFNHALIKSLLFLSAGVIIHQTGKKKISDFRGMGRKYPLTMIAFSIAALSMVGIPPLNGFISKWILALGTLQANQPYLLAVILLSSLLNGIYYFPIIVGAFFGGESSDYQWEFKSLSKKVWIPLVVFSVCILFFGLFPNFLFMFIEEASVMLLGI